MQKGGKNLTFTPDRPNISVKLCCLNNNSREINPIFTLFLLFNKFLFLIHADCILYVVRTRFCWSLDDDQFMFNDA